MLEATFNTIYHGCLQERYFQKYRCSFVGVCTVLVYIMLLLFFHSFMYPCFFYYYNIYIFSLNMYLFMTKVNLLPVHL